MLEPRFLLRHRNLHEMTDLAVVMLRQHWLSLLVAMAPGLALLWLAVWGLSRGSDEFHEAILISTAPALILALVPILSAVASTVLGGLLLDPRANLPAAWKRLRSVLPRLLRLGLYRLWPLLLLLMLPLAWFPVLIMLWYLVLVSELIRFPWMVEILVLEGQDWQSSRRRARAFSRHPQCQSAGPEYAAIAVALLSMLLVSMSGNHLYSLLMDNNLWSTWLATSFDPVQHWLPWLGLIPGLMFGIILRYIAYIGMRSDAEGWEVDMRLRLAGSALAGRTA